MKNIKHLTYVCAVLQLLWLVTIINQAVVPDHYLINPKYNFSISFNFVLVCISSILITIFYIPLLINHYFRKRVGIEHTTTINWFINSYPTSLLQLILPTITLACSNTIYSFPIVIIPYLIIFVSAMCSAMFVLFPDPYVNTRRSKY